MTLSERDTRIFLTGTDEPVAPATTVQVGSTFAVIADGALRSVSLGGVELVRQIDFPVRDENWASLPPEVVHDCLSETPDGYRYERHFEVADGALICRIAYEILDGEIKAEGEAEARRDFVTNRTGFTVLHPIDGFAGKPVTVRRASGGEENSEMPELISPGQPVRDIAGLAFGLGGVTLDITFAGDVFEMEDQRNWSDASYKTYSRPLVEPIAYTISAGEVMRQSVGVVMKGRPAAPAKPARDAISLGAPVAAPFPHLLLALQDGWLAGKAQLGPLSQCGLDRFLVRVTPENAASLLHEVEGQLAETAGRMDLEIVLPDDRPAGPFLDAVARACDAAGIAPAHVMALPEAYLASYQPTGTWPSGLSPEACIEGAKKAFPKARIGGGMLTNFTELNRRRPDRCPSDYITHTNTATVHAADDSSVMQTLETLPHIFHSARAIAGSRSYRLGLTAIGMRTNPYGDSTTDNPDQKRLTMAVWDPRARALIGAAFAVGALAATETARIEAIALAAPTGPFGILCSPGPVARPWFDDHPEAQVYPVFHILRALASGGLRLPVSGLPEKTAGVALRKGQMTRLVVANLESAPNSLTLPVEASGAILCADTFVEAVCDPLWLDNAAVSLPCEPVTLPSYGVLICDIPEGLPDGA
jgi:hypothetical protein